MLALKLVAQFWAYLLLALTILLDYWLGKDRRFKVFRDHRKTILGVLLISFLAATAVTIWDDRAASIREAAFRSQLTGLHEQLAAVRADNQHTHGQLETIRARLAPFEQIAKARHPDRTPDDALRLLASVLAEQKVHGTRLGQLELRNEPRSLTSTQTASLVGSLRGFPDQYLAILVPFGGDVEILQYAKQLQAAFADAGWRPKVIGANVYAQGLQVQIGKGTPGASARTIMTAFQKAGLAFTGVVLPEANEGSVALLIGPR